MESMKKLPLFPIEIASSPVEFVLVGATAKKENGVIARSVDAKLDLVAAARLGLGASEENVSVSDMPEFDPMDRDIYVITAKESRDSVDVRGTIVAFCWRGPSWHHTKEKLQSDFSNRAADLARVLEDYQRRAKETSGVENLLVEKSCVAERLSWILAPLIGKCSASRIGRDDEKYLKHKESRRRAVRDIVGLIAIVVLTVLISILIVKIP